MDRLDLLRKRIKFLRELTDSNNDSDRSEVHVAFDEGYDLALKHVLEMFDF